LNIHKDWFLTTIRGNKVLVVEADSSVGDEALALVPDSSLDLDH